MGALSVVLLLYITGSGALGDNCEERSSFPLPEVIIVKDLWWRWTYTKAVYTKNSTTGPAVFRGEVSSKVSAFNPDLRWFDENGQLAATVRWAPKFGMHVYDSTHTYMDCRANVIGESNDNVMYGLLRAQLAHDMQLFDAWRTEAFLRVIDRNRPVSTASVMAIATESAESDWCVEQGVGGYGEGERVVFGLAELRNSSHRLLTLEKEYNDLEHVWTLRLDPCRQGVAPAVLDTRQLVLIASTREKIGVFGLGGWCVVLLLVVVFAFMIGTVYAVCSRKRRSAGGQSRGKYSPLVQDLDEAEETLRSQPKSEGMRKLR